MSQNVRPGYFLDALGEWQKDRRQGGDRRAAQSAAHQHERRGLLRRKADREAYWNDTRAIEDALEEFAAGHGGHT